MWRCRDDAGDTLALSVDHFKMCTDDAEELMFVGGHAANYSRSGGAYEGYGWLVRGHGEGGLAGACSMGRSSTCAIKRTCQKNPFDGSFSSTLVVN
jgi:hypothetical protein